MSEPTTGGHENAAARYKELAALATAAVDRTAEHERSRVEELEDGFRDSEARVDAAQESQDQVVEGVRLRWKAAMEALWEERWMRVTGRPDPDPSAAAAPADECIRQVQAAYLDLHGCLGRSGKGWSAPSWLPRPGRRRTDRGHDPGPG